MNPLLIDRVIKERHLCDIFDDANDESFIAFITGRSESLLQLERYDEEGRPDGVLVLRTDDVSRIRWGAQETLYAADLIESRPDLLQLELASVQATAHELQEHFGYVCLTLGDLDAEMILIGRIIEEEKETLILHEYRTPSRSDRSFCMIRWGDVTRVQAGGVYEENLHRHYKQSEQNADGNSVKPPGDEQSP